MARPSLLRHPMLWTGLLLLLFLVVAYLVGDQLLTGDSVGALPWLLLIIGGPLFVFWLGYFTRDFIRSRRQLKARARQAARAPDVATARDEFAEVLNAVDTACRDRGLPGGSSGLPWILILGPPNAGKTRTLSQSGLNLQSFSLSSGAGAGTRRVELWLADQAVLMDSPGRYIGGAQDHTEWLSFLDLLRERRRQPLDSAILLVDLGELLSWSPEQRLREARTMRARLDELLRDLHVRFPVHLVFNKADRLDGFIDYCRGLPPIEQQARWGFALDLDTVDADGTNRGRSLGDAFVARFMELVLVAELRRASRVIKLSASPESRDAALVFPHELQRAVEPLRLFVEELFRLPRVGERPLLRAVYFTSATQEEGLAHAPLEPPLRESLSALLRLSSGVRRQPPGAPAPLFVSGLFLHVLTQAQDAARPTWAWLQRQRLYQRLAVSCATLVCVVLSSLLAARYQSTQDWLVSLKRTTRTLYNNTETPGIADTPFAGLGNGAIELEFTAQDALLDLLRAESSGGITAPAYAAGAERLRHRVEAQEVLPLLHAGTLSRPLNGARKGSSAEELADAFNALKATFILKNLPCAGTDPDDRRAWIVDYLVKLWRQELKADVARKLHRSSETSTRSAEALLRDLLLFYFANQAPEGKPWTRARFDDEEEKAARAQLREGDTPPGLAFKLIAGNTNLMLSKPQLRGDLIEDAGIAPVFTQTGCNEFFATENRRGEQWWSCVLGKPLSIKTRDLETEYVSQYKTAWDAWLNALTLRDLRSAERNPRRDPKPALTALIQALDDLARHPPTLLEQVMQVMGQGADRTELLSQSLSAAQEAKGGCSWKAPRIPSGVKKLVRKVDVCSDPPPSIAIFGLALPADPAAEKKDKVGNEVRVLRGFFKEYSEALVALRKRIDDLRGNEDRGPEVLKLIAETLHGGGELARVKGARIALVEALTGKEHEKEMASRAQALSKLLNGVEATAWKVLVPIGQEALDQQWTARIYALWAGYKQGYVPQPYNADSCKKVMDFVQKDLKDFVDKNLNPFFRNQDLAACDSFNPDEPFNQPRFTINSKVCSLAKIFTDAVPCPAAAPPPPPAPVPKEQASFETNNVPSNPECQFRIEQARLDNKDKVYECQQSTAACSLDSAVHGGQVARLDVKWKGARDFVPLYQADSMSTLLQRHGSEVKHLRYRFPVPATLVRNCSGFWVEMEFISVEKAKELVDPVVKIALPSSLTK